MGSQLVTVAACSLNQWALDWQGNLDRIIQSIRIAKAKGAKFRVGPELEITGYDCLDHFLENDIYLHSWEMLGKLLEDKSCHGILIDVGMPIMHRNLRFNCRLVILDSRILLIRPKMWLANDGNYREMRYFTPWSKQRYVEDFQLPRFVQDAHAGSATVPFGDAVIQTPETCFGTETCEELFTPNSPHISMGLDGVEIIANSSGSHHSLRKLDERISLLLEATKKSGGVYIYANLKGGGGERVYYDGSSMIIVNGQILAQGAQFSLDDVDVVTATVNLEEVRAFRAAPSRGIQALQNLAYQRVQTQFDITVPPDNIELKIGPTCPVKVKYHSPEEEIALGPACWLWDYLRRSGLAGFLVPLSGGIDSCATAMIVYSMCRLVAEAIEAKNDQVIRDATRLISAGDESKHVPGRAVEICSALFHTVYMGMKTQSSGETRRRAKELSTRIGAYHVDLNIDEVFQAQQKVLKQATGFEARFKVYGGTQTENLALQNIQARTRMVTAYEFAQLLPTIRNRPGGGSLLVLGSANCDEALRGYFTKYDCSSADINPIGSISKKDLKSFIHWAMLNFEIPVLESFLNATPTAELEPLTQDYVQSDEVDMGMTYDELSTFGSCRKILKLGPFGMFQKLVHEWQSKLSPSETAIKVKRFFHFYSINRNKMTTLTPAYHAEAYSPDDNRFDLRPFLLPPLTNGHSFNKIDKYVAKLERSNHAQVNASTFS